MCRFCAASRIGLMLLPLLATPAMGQDASTGPSAWTGLVDGVFAETDKCAVIAEHGVRVFEEETIAVTALTPEGMLGLEWSCRIAQSSASAPGVLATAVCSGEGLSWPTLFYVEPVEGKGNALMLTDKDANSMELERCDDLKPGDLKQ